MAKLRKSRWSSLAALGLSVGLALAVGAAIMALAGYNPAAAYGALLRGATGCESLGEFFTAAFTKRQFGNTLEYTMVLCLTGLACALGARVGIFNVGGEGQLYLGAIVSAYIGVLLAGCSPWLVIPAAALGAIAAGGIYAWIPGALKVKLKVNEVITTIMLNSIAIYLCAYLSSGPWKTSQGNRVSGTDTLAAEFRFSRLIPGSSLTTAIFAAAIMALLVWYVMSKTATGYEMKMTGQNRRFARFSGLKVDTLTMGAMAVSGAMCGLVGMFEVYGLKGSYQDGISNEFYFDGLLVAMIMRYNPVGIIGMSVLFAVLRIGATGMELHAGVPGEIYRIIQSVIIFFMAGGSGIAAPGTRPSGRLPPDWRRTMGNLLTAGLFRQMLRSATPVGLAAMGGLMTEHAGIMNIGMDGMILMGAFTAVSVSWLAGSAWLGLAAAILVGILVGLFFALFVVKFRSDEFIIGTALNIFAGGLTVFLLRALFQVKGTFQGTPGRPVVGLPQVDLGILKRIPCLGEVLDGSSLFILLTWGLVALMWVFVYRTPWGFWIRAAGEEPNTLRTAGIRPEKMKWLSSVLCGAFCGLAGAQLALGNVTMFAEGMSNSRGYVAFACVIFGAANPGKAYLAALMFGFFDALGYRLQDYHMNANLTSMIPYVITVVMMVYVVVRSQQKKKRAVTRVLPG